MYTGKRTYGPKKTTARTMKPFRQPRRGVRRTQSSVIPGLLRQTATEKKVLYTGTNDPVNATLALNTTGTVTAINLIQVGSSMFNRIGRKIEMRSIRISGQLFTATVTRATVVPDYARVLIIYDRQTNGAFPTVSDILQDTDQAGTNTTEAFSGLNMNNRERFVTIMDKRFTIPQATATAGVLTNVFPQNEMYPIKIDEFRRLRGLTTHYKADSNPAVIGDVSTGGLYAVSIAQTQAAGTELFSFQFNCRLKYVDV